MKNAGEKIEYYSIDARRDARIELSVRGELLTEEGCKPCILEDVSLSGARISGSIPLAPGDPSILRCRELDILTEVRWRSDQNLGLSFAEALDGNDTADTGVDRQQVEEAERRAKNRRFLRLFWNRI